MKLTGCLLDVLATGRDASIANRRRHGLYDAREMPPRPTLPADDLYARLGVPPDASPEAIDLAWRGLLRKHHPDIAGPAALELAKRINVAHDWLSDLSLRRRYDEERSDRGRGRRDPPSAASTGAAPPAATRRRAPRPPTTEERVTAIIERAGRLTQDELDRLALAEPAPIAFLATLRRFATVERAAMLEEAEHAAVAGLPASARRNPAVRDALSGRLAETVLGESLDELLGESGGQRARERLTRGWDAAVGQPRYGPATQAVDELLWRLRELSTAEIRTLAATGSAEALGDAPWPLATSPDEDEALRVSSELAGRDAAAAITADASQSAVAGARRAAARVAHLLVLRHAFSPGAFDRHAGPWLGTLVPRAAAWTTRVRHRPEGRPA
jgi:curved DNA-binding protein CbpA